MTEIDTLIGFLTGAFWVVSILIIYILSSRRIKKVIIMGKLAQATSKYTIVANFKADGIVEKPDVIGAVFGQTEGLLGPDMELRELQRTGRIGRIDVVIRSVNGKAEGTIYIPSSLDSSETALIAATMETIERIGPCNAKVIIEKIEDNFMNIQSS